VKEISKFHGDPIEGKADRVHVEDRNGCYVGHHDKLVGHFVVCDKVTDFPE
jgi:hypothetical protein